MDVFEAISDPTRRRIIELVAAAPRAAGEIAGEFSISRPAVSQHVAVLTACGVLRVKAQGRRRVYSLDDQALAQPHHWLEEQRHRWNSALDRLEAAMQLQDSVNQQEGKADD